MPLVIKDLLSEGQVDRTNKTMTFEKGPACLTLDYDPSTFAKTQIESPEEYLMLLKCLTPGVFEGAACGYYYSSSSFVYLPDGAEYSGEPRFHLVFAVADATEIPLIKERLFQHCVLQGFGYHFIARDGKQLLRTLFDKKVLEPQQPIFAGGAHCLDGITQRRPQPVIHPGGYINTRDLVPLTQAELQTYQRKVDESKGPSDFEAKRVRRKYQKSEAEVLVKKGMPLERARRTVESRMGGVLLGGDMLDFGENVRVSVSEVLADPETFDGRYLHDPIEPEYGSSSTAIFFANASNGSPVIFSHAHGGRNFFLKLDEESICQRLNAADPEDVKSLWKRLVVDAPLESDELERVLAVVKSRTGTPIKALREAAKKCRVGGCGGDADSLQDPALVIVRKTLRLRYGDGELLIRTESGAYWEYCATHWVPVSGKVIASVIQQVATDSWEEVKGLFAAQSKTLPALSNFVDSALSNLGNEVIKPGDPLRLRQCRPNVINMLNGELWLEKDRPVLRLHRPDSFLTFCSNIDYQPDARAPTFDEALRGMLSLPGGIPMPDQDEMFRHVVELMGYIIQTGRFLKIFVLIVGPGDNGKTCLTKLLELILGTDAIVFNRLLGVDEGGSRFASARLIGKLVLIDDDAEHGFVLPDGLLKKIAEEKPMTAERKFQDEINFVSQVVPIILANSWPKT